MQCTACCLPLPYTDGAEVPAAGASAAGASASRDAAKNLAFSVVSARGLALTPAGQHRSQVWNAMLFDLCLVVLSMCQCCQLAAATPSLERFYEISYISTGHVPAGSIGRCSPPAAACDMSLGVRYCCVLPQYA